MTINFEKNGTSLTAKPEGRLDSANSPDFEQRLEPAMDGMTQVIIDLEKVEYVSSGGLRVLLGAQQEMEDRGGTMKVIHVNPQIMQIFDMVGFLDILTVE